MSEMVYVVMASSGEYSDRSEWICGIYRDPDEAKRLVEHRSAAARAATDEYDNWCAKRNLVLRGGVLCPWPIPPELEERVLAECGPELNSGEADEFWLVSVPMEVWGHWDEYTQEPRP